MTSVWKRTSPRTASSNDDLALLGHAEADGRPLAGGDPRLRLLGRQAPAGAGVARRASGRERVLALGLELRGRAEAVVGLRRRRAAPSRTTRRGAAARTAGTARARRRRPAPRPSRARASAGRAGWPASDSRVERSTSVSSMRRMNVPPRAAREQPVEQRRAGVADVQLAGRARRESDSHTSGSMASRATRRLPAR